VRNILAIADKELRSYFASPIAYIMIGLFSLLFGVFFYLFLVAFVQQSEQMMQFGGGGAPNINQMMIGGLFQNTAVVILFMMPMITMRTYSEEKRSGTIELLLTSPLTDLEIIVGKFIGAMGLYVAMLLVTMIYIGILFIYGNPEWKPILTAYLGLILFGGCFISLGLFISSLSKNQIVAAILCFGMLIPIFSVGLLDSMFTGKGRDWLSYLNLWDHMDEFARGVVDSRRIIYYLSATVLFLLRATVSLSAKKENP